MDYEKKYKELVAKIKNAHLYAQTDSSWNQPNVKWWLDLDLPKME